ncbi:hypothetical protein A2704_00505 [Candidatus Kaiserbacteria bacterium RIFCSPHIGHO2_01_FULL_54_36b]|uniref:Uncharacterized protein n=1 Tax=Candidatus Kaiserbacteria bacterium RIFCSPHIGHO2_01_FULL_54_36b TaxID=1798483 RepID=A0A1F6CHA2_9BACT|nr:MAG: hypothetical protein A2704_00505 [Candidatus Kaiserbacteria bacterium RIFCSPHIGHO2_01_FULL_54_36b]
MEAPEREARRRAALGRLEEKRQSERATPDTGVQEPVSDVTPDATDTLGDLEYEMGTQPTVIMPDGSSRAMTPEERREITRVEAIKLARRDLGLPDEDIPPAPGMPRFKLRQLNHQGQSDVAAPEDVNERLEEASARNDAEEVGNSLQEIRARRNEARKALTEKHGNRTRVEGTRGFAWHDAESGKAFVVRGDGEVQELASGGIYNFGNRDNPVWKKWEGQASGWTDAADAGVQAIQKQPGGSEKKQKRGRSKESAHAVNEGAPGIYSYGESAPVLHEVGEKFFIKDGNRVRTLTAEEAEAFRAGTKVSSAPALTKTAPSKAEASRNKKEALRWATGGLLKEENEPEKSESEEMESEQDSSLDPSKIVRMEREGGRERLDPSKIARLDFNNPPELPKGVKLLEQPEIQANPELERNFVRVVERLDSVHGNGKEVYRKWMNKEILSDADRQLLAYARRDFALRLHEGTILAGKLNMTDLEIGMRRNTALRDEVELYGREQTLKEMKKQSLVLAMKMDDADFQQVIGAYPILDKNRNTRTYKVWEWTVKKHLEITGQPWGYYKEKTKGISTKAERIKNRFILADEIAKDRGIVLGTLSKLAPFGLSPLATARRKARGLAWRNRKDIRGATYERTAEELAEKPPVRLVNEQLSVITNFMRLTLSHDPEVRRALQDSAGFNEDVTPRETGPMTLRELRGERVRLESGALTEASVRGEWDAHRRSIKDKWNAKNPTDRKNYLNDSWEPSGLSSTHGIETPEGERRQSWLGQILTALAEMLFNRHKGKLSLDDVK